MAGEDPGEWLVSRGLALTYRRYSLDHVEEEAGARAADRGLWRSKFAPPWEWRKGKRLGSAEPEGCTVCARRHK